MHIYNKTMLSLESFGDPRLIALAGGVVVIHDGAVLGTVGWGSTQRPG